MVRGLAWAAADMAKRLATVRARIRVNFMGGLLARVGGRVCKYYCWGCLAATTFV
jgi:hypothetical protein